MKWDGKGSLRSEAELRSKNEFGKAKTTATGNKIL